MLQILLTTILYSGAGRCCCQCKCRQAWRGTWRPQRSQTSRSSLCKLKFLTDLPISLYQWTYLICGQFSLPNKGLRDALLKKNGKKRGHCPLVGGGQPQFLFLSQNLPDSQITQKWTSDTTIWVSNHSEMDFWHHNMNANALRLAWLGPLISSLPPNISLYPV